jgi:hypothetical protein
MKEPVSSLAGAPSATVAHPLGGHASADYGVEDDRVVFTDESGPLLRLRVLPSVDATLSEVRSSLRRDPSTASLRGATVRIDSGDALLDAVSMRRLVVLLRMEYGISVGGLRCTPAALQRFAERVPLADAGYFAVAVTIQRESGGNLAEVLDKIAGIVRARLRLLGEVRTLSAEGRLSAVILTALPFVVALVVHLVNPKFLAVLWTDPAGTRLVGVALAGIVVGVLWMRAVVRIRV